MIILLKNNLKKLIYEHRGVLLIVILSMIISTFGVLFFSGYYAYSYYSLTDKENCKITITLNSESTNEEISNLLLELTQPKFASITSLTVSEGEPPQIGSSELSTSIIGKKYFDNERILVGRHFKENENEPVMLLSENMLSTLGIEEPFVEDITLDSISYSIIGVLFNSEPAYIIPIPFYLQHYRVTNICAVYASIPEKDYINDFVISNQSVISSYNVEFFSSPFQSPGFLAEIIQIFLIFSFSFLNIVSVIIFWQKLFSKQYSIYHICGCTKTMITGCISLQIMIVSIVAIMIGLALYLFFLPLFIQLSIVYESVSDCLIITGIVFIITFIFTIILSHKIATKQENYKVEE